MSEIATLMVSSGGFLVAVGSLIVSVGVFYLVMKLGNAIEAMTQRGQDN